MKQTISEDRLTGLIEALARLHAEEKRIKEEIRKELLKKVKMI